MLGFDPDLVNSSIDDVEKAFNALIQAIAIDMQVKFINGMQDKWACKDAQDFFASFKKVVDALIRESNDTFQTVFDSMNSAANNWAQHTGSFWSAKSFSRLDKEMDVSVIRENIGGVRGVDPKNAPEVSKKLTEISSDADIALTAAQKAVQICGFIGGDSASQLYSSLGKIKSSIETAINQISSDCQKAIDTTAATYADLDVKISNAFAGNN